MPQPMFRRLAMIAGAALALSFGTPAAANEMVDARMQAGEPAIPAADAVPGPQLKAIDRGILYRRLMQLGMLSQVLGYKLNVDAEGQTTGCSFSRSFKSRYTAKRLCDAFIETTSFEPARDDRGEAVEGTYEGEIEIASYFQPSR